MMNRGLSNTERALLVSRLERLLCDPRQLREYVGALPATGDAWGDELAEDELGELLSQLLEDSRRLELLTDDELARLALDRLALAFLSEEVSDGWSPAWYDPFDSIGREFCESESLTPPCADHVTILGDAIETEFAEDPGALGRIIEVPASLDGRLPLVFLYEWRRALFQLDWDNKPLPDAESAPTPAEQREEVLFTIKGYSTNSKGEGRWLLLIDGALPEDRDVQVTVELDGWGRRQRDVTQITEVGASPIEIELQDFGDPTTIFTGSASGCATLKVTYLGRRVWQTIEPVPGPALDQEFLNAWWNYPVDGAQACIARVSAKLSQHGRITDRTAVAGAVNQAALKVYRKRYLSRYRLLQTFPEFSRVVFVAAVREYIDLVRQERRRARGAREVRAVARKPEVEAIISDTADRCDGSEAFEASESAGPWEHALQRYGNRLSGRERDVLRRRYIDRLPAAEVGTALGISQGNVRVIALRARRRLGGWLDPDPGI